MTNKNTDKMKQIIEEKKSKSNNEAALRPDKKMGGDARKGINSRKAGGFFDK